MTDAECVAFLRWALPRLRMRFEGFRRVRRRVCKRVVRRFRELELPDTSAYRAHLEAHPAEWATLDVLCRVPISRFYRDRGVFEALRDRVLPSLAKAAEARDAFTLRALCAGCASGEEAYSVKAVWELGVRPRFPDLSLALVATDADAGLLERAERGCFTESSVRDLPAEWRAAVFEPEGRFLRVRPRVREGIAFHREDLREQLREGRFDLILCRNVVFTYFQESLQREIAAALAARLRCGGALVLGLHESLPDATPGFAPWEVSLRIYRREAAP